MLHGATAAFRKSPFRREPDGRVVHMLSKDQIEAAVARLDQAEQTRRPIRMLSLDHPGMTIEDAYAIQRAWIGRKLARGRTIKGHKIGLTSKAMQNAVGISEPDLGVLLDDMFFYDGAQI